MTLDELRDFAKLTNELSKQNQLLETIKQYLSASIDSPTTSSGTIDEIRRDIKDMENEIAKICSERDTKLKTVEAFISAINNFETQLYMRLHYIRGMMWSEVATITGTRTEAAIKVRVRRQLRSVYNNEPNYNDI